VGLDDPERLIRLNVIERQVLQAQLCRQKISALNERCSSTHVHADRWTQPKQRFIQIKDGGPVGRAIERLGVAMNSGLNLGHEPTQITPEVGAEFVLFGGHVSGRNIEMVPEARIVQAWREANWSPGVYSIVRIELVDQGDQTLLVFDQSGFPTGGGARLAVGWFQNYWEPLKKFLGVERAAGT
jgi:Activator of Hsp90 ATPase homolog 1-like protein